MRVPPLTALGVFAGFGALCAALVAIFVIGEGNAVLGTAAAAAVAAGLAGYLVVPRVLYNAPSTAIFIGALTALLSHIPFSILWGLGISVADGRLGEAPETILAIGTIGYLFAGIPEIVLGALAGYVCYRMAVPYAAEA